MVLIAGSANLGGPLLGASSAGGGGTPASPTIMARRPGVGSEIFLPQNSNPVNIASGTPFGTWGAWVPIGVPPVNDLYVTRFGFRRQKLNTGISEEAVELGYGAGPTIFEGYRTMTVLNDAFNQTGYPYIDNNSFNVKVPAGNQIFGRVTEGDAADDWQAFLLGWDNAVPTFTPLGLDKPTGVARYFNSFDIAGGINVISGGGGAYGAWVQIDPAAPNDYLVMYGGLAFTGTAITARAYTLQYGIGAAGAEQPVGAITISRGNAMAVIDPPIWVKTGERLAVRAAYLAPVTVSTIHKVIDL